MANFPGSLPAAGSASASSTLAAAGHTSLHNTGADESRAIATKIGTGSSTPTSGVLLRGNGVGTSAWAQVTLTSDVTGVLPVANGGTGTTTLTFPAGSDTLVGRATTDTLTNKTISGASNTLTIRESDISLSNNTTNNVSTSNHGFTPVLPNDATRYLDGTGAWNNSAWSSWTPVFANFTKGSATITSKYSQIGKTVRFNLEVVLAADSSMGTAPTFTLPITAATRTTNFTFGTTYILDASAGSYNAGCLWDSSTTAKVIYWDANNNGANITSLAPMTWTTSDSFTVNGSYEAA